MTTRSLGELAYPQVSIKDFSPSRGTVVLLLEGCGKRVRVRMGIGCVKRMVQVTQEITGKQREHALSEWSQYLSMKQTTGYASPDGKE